MKLYHDRPGRPARDYPATKICANIYSPLLEQAKAFAKVDKRVSLTGLIELALFRIMDEHGKNPVEPAAYPKERAYQTVELEERRAFNEWKRIGKEAAAKARAEALKVADAERQARIAASLARQEMERRTKEAEEIL